MAPSAQIPPSAWIHHLHPDPETLKWLSAARKYVTNFAECGKGWDAVVIAPLERGLAALDVLGLPMDSGFPVLADYSRQELIIQVDAGTAHKCADVPGVRELSRGPDGRRRTWLLVPSGAYGALEAAWLSRPVNGAAHYVDAGALRSAVLTADEEPCTPRAC